METDTKNNFVGMDDVLILLIGESGTGKTSLANYLHKYYGLRILQSYTTRPKRTDSNKDHTYVSNEECKKLKNIVAENCYNGYMYCATREQCDNSDIYVIDIPGLKMLSQQYDKKKIISIYLETSENTRIQRMKLRGDTDEMIMSRLENDKKVFKNAKSLCDVTINNEFCLAMTAMLVVTEVNKFRDKIGGSFSEQH